MMGLKPIEIFRRGGYTDTPDIATERVAIGKAIEAALGDRRGSNQYQRKEDPENFPEAVGKESRQVAAERAGFGNETTYRQAKKVVEDGAPELVEAVDAGKVSVSAAAEIKTRAVWLLVSPAQDRVDQVLENLDVLVHCIWQGDIMIVQPVRSTFYPLLGMLLNKIL